MPPSSRDLGSGAISCSDKSSKSGKLLQLFLFGSRVAMMKQIQRRWFFPKGTYLDKFLDKNEEYFPFGGVRGTVFFHDVDFAEQLDTVQGQCAYDVCQILDLTIVLCVLDSSPCICRHHMPMPPSRVSSRTCARSRTLWTRSTRGRTHSSNIPTTILGRLFPARR